MVNKDANNCGKVVTFPTPVFTDNCDGAVTNTVCSPPSGSFFQIGTTVVYCTATDRQGNRGLCSFNVTVVDPTPVNLSIMRTGNLIMVTWTASCTSDTLESTPTLGLLDPVVWTDVGAPIQTIGNLRKVVLAVGPGNRFFRVRRQ